MKLLLVCLLFCTSAIRWDRISNPANLLQSSYANKLGGLPKSGRVGLQPWSGSYWPSYQGGIAFRWNAAAPRGFGYHLYSLEELRTMSPEKMKQLSPAEKYDIYAKRYDYPTVRSEWRRTYPGAPTWHGLCHGWAPAAELYFQPSPVAIINGDGITVYFGAADTKGLLTYFVAQYSNSVTRAVGRRCQGSGHGCAGMNAGAFHLIVANMIGIRGKSFIADVDHGAEVWNQPLVSYTSRVDGNRVSTEVEYTVETQQRWEPHPPQTERKHIQYGLDVTTSDEVLGGNYAVNSERWDFSWKSNAPAFAGYFAPLSFLYNAASRGTTGGASPAQWRPDAQNSSQVSSSAVWVPSSTDIEGHWTKQIPVPWQSPANFSNAVLLKSPSGKVSMEPQPVSSDALRPRSWIIQPEHTMSMTVSIPPSTRLKGRDELKIYEGSDCDGAMAFSRDGVLRSSQVDLSIDAPFCVVFRPSPPLYSGQRIDINSQTTGGFELTYFESPTM